MKRLMAVALFVALFSGTARADSSNVKEAIDVIVLFCVGGGQKYELTASAKADGGLALKKLGVGASGEIRVSKSEAKGLVEGLQREMSKFTAEQASEARKCMSPYIERVLNTLLPKSQPEASSSSPVEIVDSNVITARGSDVLVHDQVVRSITDFDPSQPVYLAYGENPGCGPQGNFWMVNKSVDVSKYELKRDGDYWVAKNMLGVQFQVVQLRNNSPGLQNIKWGQIYLFQSPHIFSGDYCGQKNRTAIYVRS